MKIIQIETIPVQVPIVPRLAIQSSRGTHTSSPFLLIKVHTDAGLTGLGEVSCTPLWSGEAHVTSSPFIRTLLGPVLLDQDPRDIERLTGQLNAVLPGNLFTKAGLEMALWDILGKSVGLPLYRLLGGPVRDSVPLKFSISGQEPAK